MWPAEFLAFVREKYEALRPALSRACVRYLRRWQRLAFELAFQATSIADDLVGRSAEVDRQRTEAKGNGKKVKQACTGETYVATRVSLDSIQAIGSTRPVHVCTQPSQRERPLP